MPIAISYFQICFCWRARLRRHNWKEQAAYRYQHPWHKNTSLAKPHSIWNSDANFRWWFDSANTSLDKLHRQAEASSETHLFQYGGSLFDQFRWMICSQFVPCFSRSQMRPSWSFCGIFHTFWWVVEELQSMHSLVASSSSCVLLVSG